MISEKSNICKADHASLQKPHYKMQASMIISRKRKKELLFWARFIFSSGFYYRFIHISAIVALWVQNRLQLYSGVEESSSTIPKSVGGMNCCVAWIKIPLISSVESAAPTEFLEAQKRLGYKRTSKTPVSVQEQGLVQSSVSFLKNAK